MAYDTKLAERIRTYLQQFPKLKTEEKKMFGGLAFMVNGKMCINISGQNLMCRFDTSKSELVAKRDGFRPMIMKGKELNGYCYVDPIGFQSPKDFEFWITLCLEFNNSAKSSRRK